MGRNRATRPADIYVRKFQPLGLMEGHHLNGTFFKGLYVWVIEICLGEKRTKTA